MSQRYVGYSRPTLHVASPRPKILLGLTKEEREEANWYLQCGLPIQGRIAKRLLEIERERK